MNVALHTERLNIVSLCTGGFGLDHAVELAIPSARTVCMVEREAFAVAQLVCSMEAGSLAPAPIWSDARTFNGRPWRGLVDGLIGGIPCQPHSLAGKQLGEEDERDLWSTARRIIVQSGAWFVLIENVRGMLSSGGAERVWRDLHRLGFTVEGGLFTAAEVGAPHERERLFILAVADRISGRRNEGSRLGPTRHRSAELVPANRGADVSGVGLADAFSEGLEGIEPGGTARPRQQGTAAERVGCYVVNSKGIGCGARRAEPEGQRGQPGIAEPSSSVGNASSIVGADVVDRAGATGQRLVAIDRTASGNGHGGGSARGLSREREDATASRLRSLFPPGPSDLDGWRDALEAAPELEPAFRRVADGMASRLDIGRVDRLRMLGNGVVPLEGAYAIRTLATRLAARGSAAATRLVRMMEEY